jgi:hypothetical protein
MKLYENKHNPLLPKEKFQQRLRKNIRVAFLLLLASLFIGISGYHWLGGFGWIDSLLNASMILGGMGPVDTLHTNGAKIFASGYAIFSGIAIIGIIGVIAAPIAHRFMHKFHLSEESENTSHGKGHR